MAGRAFRESASLGLGFHRRRLSPKHDEYYCDSGVDWITPHKSACDRRCSGRHRRGAALPVLTCVAVKVGCGITVAKSTCHQR